MKERIIALAVIVVLAAGVAVLVNQKHKSPRATRERMVEQFIAILPDSLDNEHILEIRQLFYMMSERERQGKVKPESAAEIDAKLAGWVERGRITASDLVRFMAEVGYNTYKDDEKYMPPDGSNDNPILNPDAGRVSLDFDSTQFDSTFWSEFEQWKKDNPELVDSLMQEYYSRPGATPQPPKGH